MRRVLFLLVGVAVVSATLLAQTPAFEVVSIKPNKSEASSQFRIEPGGRVTWTNATLSAMVTGAYQRFTRDARELVGGPDWFNEARFDVIALAPGGLPPVDADGFAAGTTGSETRIHQRAGRSPRHRPRGAAFDKLTT